MTEQESMSIHEAHGHFARTLNGRVWTLMGMEERTLAQDDEMVHAAHASLYHWLQVGTAVNHQRGMWLLSRVYAVLGKHGQAVGYAERCVTLTEEHPQDMQDFDWAFAFESMARALALAGEAQSSGSWMARARKAGENIQDPKDREIFEGDLTSGPWPA